MSNKITVMNDELFYVYYKIPLHEAISRLKNINDNLFIMKSNKKENLVNGDIFKYYNKIKVFRCKPLYTENYTENFLYDVNFNYIAKVDCTEENLNIKDLNMTIDNFTIDICKIDKYEFYKLIGIK